MFQLIQTGVGYLTQAMGWNEAEDTYVAEETKPLAEHQPKKTLSTPELSGAEHIGLSLSPNKLLDQQCVERLGHKIGFFYRQSTILLKKIKDLKVDTETSKIDKEQQAATLYLEIFRLYIDYTSSKEFAEIQKSALSPELQSLQLVADRAKATLHLNTTLNLSKGLNSLQLWFNLSLSILKGLAGNITEEEMTKIPRTHLSDFMSTLTFDQFIFSQIKVFNCGFMLINLYQLKPELPLFCEIYAQLIMNVEWFLERMESFSCFNININTRLSKNALSSFEFMEQLHKVMFDNVFSTDKSGDKEKLNYIVCCFRFYKHLMPPASILPLIFYLNTIKCFPIKTNFELIIKSINYFLLQLMPAGSLESYFCPTLDSLVFVSTSPNGWLYRTLKDKELDSHAVSLKAELESIKAVCFIYTQTHSPKTPPPPQEINWLSIEHSPMNIRAKPREEAVQSLRRALAIPAINKQKQLSHSVSVHKTDTKQLYQLTVEMNKVWQPLEVHCNSRSTEQLPTEQVCRAKG
ncbi:hypothetical protein D5018_08845, partial [Parashewanella curva]